jgi:carboxylesterase type B
LSRYPDSNKDAALAEIITDWLFYCPSRTAARVLSAHLVPVHSDAPLWMCAFPFIRVVAPQLQPKLAPQLVCRYRFNHTLSVDPWGPHYQPCASHVCHGVELAFVFCTAHVLGYNTTSEEEALCVRMQAAWGAFARGQDDGLWPQYNATEGVMHVWSTPADSTLQHVQQGVCEALWDTVPY